MSYIISFFSVLQNSNSSSCQFYSVAVGRSLVETVLLVGNDLDLGLGRKYCGTRKLFGFCFFEEMKMRR
jgi:hypothetical protein